MRTVRTSAYEKNFGAYEKKVRTSAYEMIFNKKEIIRITKFFSDFNQLDGYMKTCGWERKRQGMESEVSSIVLSHLGVLSRHFKTYFPEEQHELLQKNLWILDLFNAETTDQELIDLSTDLNQKVLFQKKTTITLAFGFRCISSRVQNCL